MEDTFTIVLLLLGLLIGNPIILYSSRERTVAFRLVAVLVFSFSVVLALQLPINYWMKSGAPLINRLFGSAMQVFVSSHGDSALPGFIIVTFVGPLIIPLTTVLVTHSIAHRERISTAAFRMLIATFAWLILLAIVGAM